MPSYLSHSSPRRLSPEPSSLRAHMTDSSQLAHPWTQSRRREPSLLTCMHEGSVTVSPIHWSDDPSNLLECPPLKHSAGSITWSSLSSPSTRWLTHLDRASGLAECLLALWVRE